MKKGGRKGMGRRKGGKSWLGAPWCTRPRVTPRGGPGPRGCPRGCGWPALKPPSAPPAPRSSLRAAAPSPACPPVLVEGAGGSEVDKVEGRLMAGPHDTIRSAVLSQRRSQLEPSSSSSPPHRFTTTSPCWSSGCSTSRSCRTAVPEQSEWVSA